MSPLNQWVVQQKNFSPTKNSNGQVLFEALIALAIFLLFLNWTWELSQKTNRELHKIRYAEKEK